MASVILFYIICVYIVALSDLPPNYIVPPTGAVPSLTMSAFHGV